MKYATLIALMVMLILSTMLLILNFDKARHFSVLIIILSATFLPLIIVGLYMMFTGKGSWAIAGYNTSPKEVKDTYNEVELSKMVGAVLAIFCGIILLGIFAATLMSGGLYVIVATILIGTIFMVFAVIHLNRDRRYLKDINTQVSLREEKSKRVKGSKKTTQVTIPVRRIAPENRKKENRTAVIIITISLIATVILTAFVLTDGDIDVDITDDDITVNGPMVNVTIDYANLDRIDGKTMKIEFRYDFDAGSRTMGYGTLRVQSGNFNNEEFGDYKLATYTGTKAFIIIQYNDGSVLVFNQQSVEETEKVFDDFMSRLVGLTGNHIIEHLTYSETIYSSGDPTETIL